MTTTLPYVAKGDPHVAAHNDERTLINSMIESLNVLPLDALFDSFQRSDRDLEGDSAPTGHVFTVQNPDSVFIVDHKLVFDIPSGATAIAYSRLSNTAKTVSTKFQFVDVLQHQNMVIGVCPISFGDLSLQLATYASPSTDVPTDNTGLTWGLFTVRQNPGNPADYEMLASNLTHEELEITPQLDTPYTQSMQFMGLDTVVVTLIDGTTRTITDSSLAEIVGNLVGWQMRRATIDTAGVEVLSIAAGSLPAEKQPYAGSTPVFDGSDYNYIQTSNPNLSNDNLDVTFSIDDWASGRADKIVTCYERSGNRSWSIGRTSANSIALVFYIADVATSVTTGTTSIPSGTKHVRVTRDATTGDVKFWATNSDASRKLLTTDPSWVVFKTRTLAVDGIPIGAIDDSVAPLRIGYPTATEDWFTGSVRYLNVRDGINGTIKAERDFISDSLQTEKDSAGKIWKNLGSAIAWSPITYTIPPAAASVISTFSTPGSDYPFDLDSNMKTLTLLVQAGAGGGGSGRQGAAGSVRCGGGGGAAGAYTEWVVDAQALWSAGVHTLYVDVGAAGSFGAAVTTPDTDGNPGTSGGASAVKTSAGTATSVNTLAKSNGGAGGSGGTNATGLGGGAPQGRYFGGAGRAAATNGGVGTAAVPVNSAPSGGGPGGGIMASDAVQSGGDGGSAPGWLSSATAAGGTAGAAGGNGSTPAYGPIYGSSGAGGASSKTAAAGSGGSGGRGAGGGGGGASLNGFNSGPGGPPGAGIVKIVAWY